MLARLRPTLDFMPSPIEDKPGLLIRDPFQFSDATLIVPPALIEFLQFYDGNRSALDLRAELVRVAGDVQAGQIEGQLTTALSRAGFLEDEHFEQLRHAAEQAFAEAPSRAPAHAGSGYPDEPGELAKTISGYLAGGEKSADQSNDRVLAIAAPHVSPFGGIEAYRAAYASLCPEDATRTFVILGTSHYGHSDRIGLTRKPFDTPFGRAITDVALVDKIAAEAGDAACMEDYCHAIEHSIEFQIVFLQHLFGPDIRIVPVLCGTWSSLFQGGGFPEETDAARRIFGALGELAAREGDRLLWVLGVDMAHMGRRYGDPIQAHAGHDEMQAVERQDRARIARMESGDAPGFWELVRENGDELKWCGSAPIYTFLKAVPNARGRLRQYQQWNIDPESVVSFAGMSFHTR